MGNSTPKTTLYRYFDDTGQLLYVGITGDNTKRQSQHRRSSFWFGYIASATFEHFDTRQEAAQAEITAIQSEKPKHNSQHLNSKKAEFKPLELFAKFHLLSMMSGYDLNKKPVEIDAQHRNFKVAIDKFDLKNEFYNFDECLVMELEHLIWLEVKKEIQLPNIDTCEMCQTLLSSEWFANTLIEINNKTDRSRMEFVNATR
jgi:predicted GIY-YIG superfamily endonuclease